MKTEVRGLSRKDLNLWTNDCRNLKIPKLEMTEDNIPWLSSDSYEKGLELSTNLIYRIPEEYRYLINPARNPCSEIFISTPGKTFWVQETYEREKESSYIPFEGVVMDKDWPTDGNIFETLTGESKKMSKFEMKTFINGNDAKHLSDEDLVDCIVKSEAELKALKKINTNSVNIADKIEVLECYLESVADYLDNRGEY